ncbi:DNA modification methylase [Mycobacteroides chelonae]|uniref:DNA modification methylase n=1 Tax=Mycobacteroides chelonae TaxID=1774 RepID=UPI0008A9515A|nr:DNA methyltransferase [Mycobacteroides chelonae]OHU29036.1 DNA modification methylase [Mycobacteroides chelonae]
MPEYTQLAVDDLQTFGGNPRRGVVSQIAVSLTKHGQYRPIVVNLGTRTGRRYEVLAGNHTLMAARSLGWDVIDVGIVDVDEDTARSIVAADNRLADLGEYDTADLYQLLSSIEDLDGTGYALDDLLAMQRDLFPPEPLTDPDDVPPTPESAVSRSGQLWALGDHRLLVGSATDLDGVRQLCGDVQPDCVWTDPPYGVEYVGKTKRALRIQNDGARGLPGLLTAAFGVVAQVCRPGAPVYVAHADTERVTFESALLASGLLVRQNLVWVKNAMVMGRSDYHYQHEPVLLAELDDENLDEGPDHEPVLYGFNSGGSGRLGRGGDRWFGDNRQTTVFQFQKPPRNADHPTMKPVALIDAMLANSLPPGGVVLDPFSGSGSTLIAAHGRQSRCFGVELDPRYADVILRRFEEHTGIVPELDGEPVSFANAA